MNGDSNAGITRRRVLQAGVGLTATSLSGCALGGQAGGADSAAGGAGKRVFVRLTGGSRQDVFQRYVWPEFTKVTGIQVVPVTANLAKMLAMVKAGQTGIDVVDTGALGIDSLRRQGALVKLDTQRFQRFRMADVEKSDDYWVSVELYSEILAVNTRASKARPASWAEFWDTGRFPGRRVLEDAAGEKPPLEQALLADGVSLDTLYPLDLDRAFKSLARIKPRILKFWSSGSEVDSLFTTGQAVFGQAWSGRIAALAAAGSPLQIEWNEAANASQALGILKGTPREAFAYQYIDFVMSPEIQATTARNLPYAPGNRKALDLIRDPKVTDNFGNSPKYEGRVFNIDVNWWGDNMNEVMKRWSVFTAT